MYAQYKSQNHNSNNNIKKTILSRRVSQSYSVYDFLLLRSVDRPPHTHCHIPKWNLLTCADDHIGKWMISANNKLPMRLTDLNNLCAQHAHSRSSSAYSYTSIYASQVKLFSLILIRCAHVLLFHFDVHASTHLCLADTIR